MKFATRSRPAPALPGVTGPVRHLRAGASSRDLHAGDVVLLDHVDLDRSSAQALVDAGVVAVLNVSSMISGRFPNQGPRVLVDAGIAMVDALGAEAFQRIKAGSTVRIDGDTVHVGEDEMVLGRALDAETVTEQLSAAREGMASQMASLTHNSTEFIRREQEVLLHEEGLPRLRTSIEGRPVVVIGAGPGWQQELRLARPFIREQRPIVMVVAEVADAAAAVGHRADVVVVPGDTEVHPRAKVLRRARDVVALVDHGAGASVTEHLDRLGVRPLRFDTAATAADAAMIMAASAGASVVVAVGVPAVLEDFLDAGRRGLASSFVTRLKVGSTLVNAASLPALYDGAVRPRHLLGVTLAGLVAVAAAVGVTPVGQEWLSDLTPALTSLIDQARGLLP